MGEGDDTPERFASALRRISEAAHQRRAEGNRAFAGALARWTVDGTAAELPSAEVIAVEAVLGDVVVPLAKHAPVLLVVLDGCGLAPFLELADQFAQFGLKEIGQERSSPRRARRAADGHRSITHVAAVRASSASVPQRTRSESCRSTPKISKLGGRPADGRPPPSGPGQRSRARACRPPSARRSGRPAPAW